MRELFSIAGSDSEWLERASGAILNVLGPARADWWSTIWDLHDGAVAATVGAWNSDRGERMVSVFPRTTLPDLNERLRRAGGLTSVTASGLWTEASRDFFRDIRCEDATAATCGDLRTGLVVGRLLPRKSPQALGNRRALAPVVRAVSIAWRARRTLRWGGAAEMADAVLSPRGEVLHASGPASDPSVVQVLRAAVAERERERNCKRPADTLIACSAIWTKLVSGRWSLIDDYEDGGRRYILAVRNDAYANEFMLSAAEARTIELSVLGRSPKQMVDELGVSISRVYALRHSALRKLSARSIADVIALARQRPATFFGRIPLGQDALIALRGPAVEQDLSVLSAAEREVGRDLLRAVPQRDIARRRGRALRTVANQVRSIYRKLGVSDRNEFVTLVRAGTRPRRH